MILKVEPGASCAWMALFSSGLSGSVTSLFHSPREIRTAKLLGSKVGRLTIARISPVRGSIAIMAPFLPSIASSAAICRSISTVNLSWVPGTAGVSLRLCTSLPRLLTIVRRAPFLPINIWLYWSSMPDLPTTSPGL